MTNVRRPLMALLALFAGPVILDRIGLAHSGAEAIDSYAYLITAGVVFGAFALRSLRRARGWVPAVLAAFAWVAVGVASGRSIEAIEPYDALTELAFVVLAAVLAHSIATGLESIDDTLASVAFGESPALALDGPKAANEIHAEMARSRRHDRALSVTVIVPDPDSVELAIERSGEEVERALRTRYVKSRFARAVADQLRRSDLLFEDPETGRLVILSPETTTEGTALLVNRIRESTRRLRLGFTAGSAAFPTHALTFEQLVARAEDRLTPIEGRPTLQAVPDLNGENVAPDLEGEPA